MEASAHTGGGGGGGFLLVIALTKGQLLSMSAQKKLLSERKLFFVSFEVVLPSMEI